MPAVVISEFVANLDEEELEPGSATHIEKTLVEINDVSKILFPLINIGLFSFLTLQEPA